MTSRSEARPASIEERLRDRANAFDEGRSKKDGSVEREAWPAMRDLCREAASEIHELKEALAASGCRSCGEGNEPGRGYGVPITGCVNSYHVTRRRLLSQDEKAGEAR